MALQPQQNQEQHTCFLCPIILPNTAEPPETQNRFHPLDNVWCGPYSLKQDHIATTRPASQARTLSVPKWAHRDCKRWAERIMRLDDFPEEGEKAVYGYKEVETQKCVEGCKQMGAFVKCGVFSCKKYMHYRCLRTIPEKVFIWKNNCVFLCPTHKGLHRNKSYQIYNDEYKAPDGFSECTLLPIHILQYATEQALAAGHLFNFDHLGQEIFTEWPEEQKNFFNTLMQNDEHVAAARDRDAQAQGVLVADSQIQHANSAKGLFANENVAENAHIARFFGTIVYRDLQQYREQEPGDEPLPLYGPDYPWLQVSVERFTDYGMQVGLEGKLRVKLRRNYVWIVPPAFCAASYVNSWEYYPGDPQLPALLENSLPADQVRRPSTRFTAIPEKVGDEDQLAPMTINILSFAHINQGDEIYADYNGTWDPPNPANVDNENDEQGNDAN